ncbi:MULTISPECIES: tRNA-dihydrouridine synthase [unclassified Exiguobacterium]|uniref:tRNA-dihydrouridine synthase n=1 Tax=unclassified Exiguobacterium TaxID=2644629 RepID=UPI001BEA930F|nr:MULTISPECIES: tRNA-dihydrouridine synthase [unclassified Exiguobacterium]
MVGKKVYEGDFQFLWEMVQIVSIPVIAEGNVITPEHARKVLEIGTYAVVVGGAITRPQQIAKRFMEGIHSLSPR